MAWVAEPFHTRHRLGVFPVPTPLLYTYVCPENEETFLKPFGDMVAGSFHWGPAFGQVRSLRALSLAGNDLRHSTVRRLRRQRPIVKDPMALFSAPWIHRRFDAGVIVMIRHPAAIMYSLKRLGWRFNFDHLLRQPLLVRDLLEPWHHDIADLAADKNVGLVDHAALLWRVMYGTVDRWRSEWPAWQYIRHEDLSRDPHAGFALLFDWLGEEYGDSVARFVSSTTAPGNPVAAPRGQTHALRRDSRANRSAWMAQLDSHEIERLRELTADVADRWYGPEDW